MDKTFKDVSLQFSGLNLIKNHSICDIFNSIFMFIEFQVETCSSCATLYMQWPLLVNGFSGKNIKNLSHLSFLMRKHL